MRHRLDRRWIFWQAASAAQRSASPAPRGWGGRLASYDLATPNDPVTDSLTPPADPLADLKAEPPGADGIRTGLVARVRQLIADGTYDTPDRWSATEERLLRRFADE